jgi:hypothetical protein
MADLIEFSLPCTSLFKFPSWRYLLVSKLHAPHTQGELVRLTVPLFVCLQANITAHRALHRQPLVTRWTVDDGRWTLLKFG